MKISAKYEEMNCKRMWNYGIETLSLEELYEKMERGLLCKQLNFVMKNCNFYKDKFKQAGFGNNYIFPKDFELDKLPFTEKGEVIKDQEDYPPFGRLLSVSPDEIIRIHRTSGYSGRPVLIALTHCDIEDTIEAGARTFWCAGVRPDDIIIHCLNYSLWIGGLTDHLSLEKTGATVVPYGVGNSRNLIELIRYLKPTGISCTPSYLSRLEELLNSEFGLKPKDLQIKKGIFGGEPGMQNHDIRRKIEEKWGLRAIDANFGVSDVLSAFGSECEIRNGLHFHGQGIIHAELINPSDGKNIEFKKGRIGELVYTNLTRRAQPLIRFRSHDMVEIIQVGKCVCGRKGFRFEVLGRSDDMITVKGINIFPTAIENLLVEFPAFITGEFEILIDRNPPYEYLNIRIEHRSGLSEPDKISVKESIQNKIRESLVFTAKVELIPIGTIIKDEGKARRIKRVNIIQEGIRGGLTNEKK